MPLSAIGPSRPFLTGLAGTLLLVATSTAFAQTAPETIRINVEPAKPGIRSVTIDRKYRPIISRDDAGVVIDTLGSAAELPPCDVELEVTLENSRVLHRSADICSGGTLVVDVTNDGKPGKARVIGGTSGTVSAPAAPSAPSATTITEQAAPSSGGLQPVTTEQPAIVTPETDQATSEPDSLLKPLEQVEIDGGSDLSGIGGETAPSSDTFGTPSVDQNGITISASDARVWTAQTGSGGGTRTDLTHGVPETDDIDFRAACRTQSGQATIVFSQTSSATAEGVTQPVQIVAGDFSATYTAIGGSTSNQYGQSFPQIALPMTDPLWQALIAQSELTVQVQGTPAYAVSLKGSAQPVRLFVATCSEPQRILGESGLPGQGGTPVAAGSDVSCRELGRVRSLDGNRPGQIVFRNTSRDAVDVHWIDYNGGERVYARLQPGQILEQQTYVSHAWMVRSAGGQCLGIYVSRTPYREVVISGGSTAPSQPSQPLGAPQEPFLPAGPVPPGSVGAGPGPSFDNRTSATLSANGRVADYLCTAGVDLQVSFSADGSTATVAEMGQGVVTLPRQGGPSSFNYASQGYILRGQIQNATWSRPGIRDVFCAMR
ncbi:hypothetical protein [Roseibium polysiphoniae]|uniref:von Hippel-Lindau disease tumour suppressor beta domain-containing protein n=1 Tax=Roseibium polysiphoniae TaxID=2571221 RepID=A0ABR9CCL3_9HYPH|nr:hypothetical protein [Roseibium polysiphoniae]MBD8877636.1 hypothetical protein [Roseibium polysiphoniae]